jgi:hypothetical protein
LLAEGDVASATRLRGSADATGHKAFESSDPSESELGWSSHASLEAGGLPTLEQDERTAEKSEEEPHTNDLVEVSVPASLDEQIPGVIDLLVVSVGDLETNPRYTGDAAPRGAHVGFLQQARVWG